MSFLHLPNDIDMSKVTISFWFRLPQATKDQLLAMVLPRGGAYGFSEPNTWPVLQKTLTLLSWGDQPDGTVYNDTLEVIGYSYDATGFPPPTTNYGPLPTQSQSGPMPPCYIGLDFSSTFYNWTLDPDAEAAARANDVCFAVNLQFATKPSISGYKNYLTTWNVDFIGTPGVSGFLKETLIHTDYSNTVEVPAVIGGVAAPNITTDAWHHVLISWDVSGEERGAPGAVYGPSVSVPDYDPADYITSSFKMYLALDDENYSGNDLPAHWTQRGDENNIATSDIIWQVAGTPGSTGQSTPTFVEDATGPGSYNLTLSALPARSLYVPGWISYIDGGPRSPINSVFIVEMAELQIFTGVVLDTSGVDNRRLFITEKGTAETTFKSASPRDVPKVDDILGSPVIRLHGTKDWQAGKNTGTAGEFSPTGTINKYSGPKLGT